MKQILLISLSICLIGTSCKKDKAGNPSPNPTPSGNMTAFETSLVGSWKLKKTIFRDYDVYPGFGDSTAGYENHYNYLNSMLELTSTPNGNQQYNGYMGTVDNQAPNNISWSGGSNNTITLGSDINYFIVKHLTPDSLVLEFNGYDTYFCYNKNTIPPSLNDVEKKLIGGKWKLDSYHGIPPSNPTYITFTSIWGTGTYMVKDSVVGGGVWVVDGWQVLFPERASPIFVGYFGNSLSGGAKIRTLTANSLILDEFDDPSVNNNTTYSIVYSR